MLRLQGGAQRITARTMPGEYARYLNGTVVALVRADPLFVQPTPMGATWHGVVDLQASGPDGMDRGTGAILATTSKR